MTYSSLWWGCFSCFGVAKPFRKVDIHGNLYKMKEFTGCHTSSLQGGSFLHEARSAVILIVIIALIAGVAFLRSQRANRRVYGHPDYRRNKTGLDLRGGVYAVYQAQDDAEGDFGTKLDTAISILETRLTSQGIRRPPLFSRERTVSALRFPTCRIPSRCLTSRNARPPEFLDPSGNVILTGEHVKTAQPQIDSSTANMSLAIRLTTRARSSLRRPPPSLSAGR
jgi:preprotein translocase subunit SecD